MARLVALLVTTELDRASVERLHDLALHVGLEPELAVLDTLVNHIIIKSRERLVNRLDLRVLLVATEGEVKRILRRAVLVKYIHAKGALETGRLHNESTRITVVQVGKLAA